ncbi:MAG TPA: ParB/RepB/Spo0J family partition protein [Thermoleophilia bacterium]|nr:ParB/RepB/Spo0J family partition protein [Thermoleophilia bacterium]
MAAKKPVLGRGLAALLGEAAQADTIVDLGGVTVVGQSAGGTPAISTTSGPAGVIELPVSSIRRNPRQPRRAFDQSALDELATSISSVGVVQPVIVREVEGAFELIAGERRWRAAQIAGYTLIPAIVRNASDVESLELALVENVVRQQLNPVDEAYALKVLLEDLGVTQDNLAARVGRSRSAIANKIRLLDLPATIQESLATGAISEGHGRALLGLAERGKQLRLARRVMEKGLSVRQVEEEVRRLTDRAPATKKTTEIAPLDSQTLDEVRQAFLSATGVMPRVKSRGTGVVIELWCQDRGDLSRIIERLGS